MVMNEKGRSVYTDRPFAKGQFVCEYFGELLDGKQAKLRESLYAEQNKGNFLFYFHHKGKRMWLVEFDMLKHYIGSHSTA